MQKRKIGCGVLVTVLVALDLILVLLWRMPYEAERICRNLLEQGLLNDRNECTLSREPQEYIPAMFPIHEANIDYVIRGMHGFRVINRAQAVLCEDGRDLTVIDFALVGQIYEVDFAFCGEELVTIHFSD